jgi:cbb3-type cytochrome oxidase maturation protein
MSVLYVLIIISILMAAAFLGAFIWSVRSGQYDDDYTPSVRVLFEPELEHQPESGADFKGKNSKTKNK